MPENLQQFFRFRSRDVNTRMSDREHDRKREDDRERADERLI
jgi:hypothetical protein